MIKIIITPVQFFVLVLLSINLQAQQPEYKNESYSYEERARDLLTRLTLEEKIYQMATQYPNANVRLDIPNLVAGECLHGVRADYATTYPQAIGLAATWDPELVEKVANNIGREARALGIHQCYTPMIAVVRDARWGRVEESYGEDPYLVSRIGVAFINGLQGAGEQRYDEEHIMATAKHYIADGEPTGGLNGAPMDISERKLREVHLPPFEAAIKEAKVGSIMPAHHALNGMPCHANSWIMQDILRDDLGFDGLVVSDNNDIYYLWKSRLMEDEYYVAESVVEAARMSLEVGVHQELAIWQPWGDHRVYGPPLLEAVQKGKIKESLVDNAVYHALLAKFQLGLFDNETPVDLDMDISISMASVDSQRAGDEIEMNTKLRPFGQPEEGFMEVLENPESNALALEAAEKTITLLQNNHDVLPINVSSIQSIAVIGPNADTVRLGGYSTEKPRYLVSVLDGIRQYVGSDIEVIYEKGCHLYDASQKDIPGAVRAAEKADVVILAVGGSEETVRENIDRSDITLMGAQNELIEAISNVSKPTVMALIHGRPNDITKQIKQVDAVLSCWYLGQETGNALANVLFGQINPGGKLPITFPRSVGQVPAYYNKLPWGREPRYFLADTEPLFPFGFGLSYTTFEISTPDLSKNVIQIGDSVTVNIQVTNTGKRKGDEVVQLYLTDVISSLVRPGIELKRFQRVTLEPGETKDLRFVLGSDDFKFWKDGAWIVEPGEFKIHTGSNSGDLKTSVLNIVK